MKYHYRFTPRRVRMAGNAVLALFAVGGIAFLVSASMNAIRSATQEISPVQHDQAILQHEHPSGDPATPIDQRIAQREAIIAQLKDPAVKEGQQKILAVLYHERGASALAQGRLSDAEQSFQTALALDP